MFDRQSAIAAYDIFKRSFKDAVSSYDDKLVVSSETSLFYKGDIAVKFSVILKLLDRYSNTITKELMLGKIIFDDKNNTVSTSYNDAFVKVFVNNEVAYAIRYPAKKYLKDETISLDNTSIVRFFMNLAEELADFIVNFSAPEFDKTKTASAEVVSGDRVLKEIVDSDYDPDIIEHVFSNKKLASLKNSEGEFIAAVIARESSNVAKMLLDYPDVLKLRNNCGSLVVEMCADWEEVALKIVEDAPSETGEIIISNDKRLVDYLAEQYSETADVVLKHFKSYDIHTVINALSFFYFLYDNEFYKFENEICKGNEEFCKYVLKNKGRINDESRIKFIPVDKILTKIEDHVDAVDSLKIKIKK